MPPPPERAPRPVFHTLPVGTSLVRLFDPSRYQASGFRSFGPLARFGHHRGRGEERGPASDPERGIYYAAPSLSSCLVEVFGDTGVIDLQTYRVAAPRLTRDLRLLDLRGQSAMRAGTNAALAKVPDRALSQAWSRHFYENPEVYTRIDGLLYFNAHNDEEALALYERAAPALECPPERIIQLDDEALRPAILDVANDNDLVLYSR